MNREQKAYALARTALEALEAEEQSCQAEYLKNQNITNEDGSVPTAIYMIDDDVLFDRVNDEFSQRIIDSGLWGKITEARQTLRSAENSLIAYGLSLAPTRERKIITDGCKTSYATRQKVLDLAFRLDTRTVPIERRFS